jgi:CO/xanthine dehydrogenase Mo-binding subunit
MKPQDEHAEFPAGWGFVTSLDRREFLTLTSSGLLVLFTARLGAGQEPTRLPTSRQGYPTDLNAYVHIGPDGRVTCLVGKIEMGQGVMTSLPQLVAEELDVPLSSVDIVMGDTDLCPWDMGTFGSLSTRQVCRGRRPSRRAACPHPAAAGPRSLNYGGRHRRSRKDAGCARGSRRRSHCRASRPSR